MKKDLATKLVIAVLMTAFICSVAFLGCAKKEEEVASIILGCIAMSVLVLTLLALFSSVLAKIFEDITGDCNSHLAMAISAAAMQ